MAHSDELPGSGIEIVLADDHTMVRRGLRMLLDSEPSLTVVLDLNELWAHVHEPPPALLEARPELPPALGAAVARALAKQPDARPRTAGELADEARAAVLRP